jgi:hypothetical protein
MRCTSADLNGPGEEIKHKNNTPESRRDISDFSPVGLARFVYHDCLALRGHR